MAVTKEKEEDPEHSWCLAISSCQNGLWGPRENGHNFTGSLSLLQIRRYTSHGTKDLQRWHKVFYSFTWNYIHFPLLLLFTLHQNSLSCHGWMAKSGVTEDCNLLKGLMTYLTFKILVASTALPPCGSWTNLGSSLNKPLISTSSDSY